MGLMEVMKKFKNLISIVLLIFGICFIFPNIAFALDYENGHFECYKPSGSKWQTINKEDNRRYLKNAYRVLLTRAREGFIIFIPKGDNSDNTRLCKYYDELWKYLDIIGIEIV